MSFSGLLSRPRLFGRLDSGTFFKTRDYRRRLDGPRQTPQPDGQGRNFMPRLLLRRRQPQLRVDFRLIENADLRRDTSADRGRSGRGCARCGIPRACPRRRCALGVGFREPRRADIEAVADGRRAAARIIDLGSGVSVRALWGSMLSAAAPRRAIGNQRHVGETARVRMRCAETTSVMPSDCAIGDSAWLM